MRDVTRPPKTILTRRNRFPGGAVLAALALLAWTGSAAAEPPEDKPEFQAAAANKPVLTMDERTDVGAASLVMSGSPTGTEGLGELALLSAGEYERFWTFWDPNVVRAVAPEVLAHVKDRTALTQEIGDQEQDAYFWMLFYANRTSPRRWTRPPRRTPTWTGFTCSRNRGTTVATSSTLTANWCDYGSSTRSRWPPRRA